MADPRYEQDGNRPADADRGREGFGDDGGTRVGRPDEGHPAPERAPLHGEGMGRVPGQPGTNTDPVPGGIEGSIHANRDASRQGAEQSRVQDDADPRSGDERPEYDL